MNDIPFFATNKRWFRYETLTNQQGIDFQRFELTNKATPAAIESFQQTMITIAPDNQLVPTNLNRFQQALGFAARQHYLQEAHGLDSQQVKAALQLISCAIRSYQLLDDNMSAPNTLIFPKRIATLYHRFLKQHPVRISDPELTAWIMVQDT